MGTHIESHEQKKTRKNRRKINTRKMKKPQSISRTKLTILKSSYRTKSTVHQVQTTTRARPTMAMLHTADIYRHVVDHFSTIDIDNLETFEAIKEYRSIYAWMLMSFEDYYKFVNYHPSTTTRYIKLALEKAKEHLTKESSTVPVLTQPPDQIYITKTTRIEALKGLTLDQARVCLLHHYDEIGKEYDITSVNTTPPHQLVYDLYFVIEDYQR